MNNLNYDEYKKITFFKWFDHFRAFSILTVTVFHAWDRFIPQHFPSLVGFVNLGAKAIDLFFLISGFLISTLLLREKEKTGRISLRGFYWRRTLRIFPLYYTILLLHIAIVTFFYKDTFEGQTFFKNLPYFLTYTTNWFVTLGDDHRTIFFFVWTLAAEEQFYLIWPSFQKFFNPVVTLFITVIALILLHVRGSLALSGYFGMVINSIPIAIFLGIFIAHLLHFRAIYSKILVLLDYPFWITLSLCFGTWYFLHFTYPYFMALAVMHAAILKKGPPLKILGSMGHVSYGMYMLHILAINFVFKLLPNSHFFSVAAIVAITYGSALLSYRYFEGPLLKFKHLFNFKS